MEICDRHLDGGHAKQFIRRFIYTDEEVSWIVKALRQVRNLQLLKTRHSIAKDFKQKYGRKFSVKSIERIFIRFLHDIPDERTKFNKLIKGASWLVDQGHGAGKVF